MTSIRACSDSRKDLDEPEPSSSKMDEDNMLINDGNVSGENENGVLALQSLVSELREKLLISQKK